MMNLNWQMVPILFQIFKIILNILFKIISNILFKIILNTSRNSPRQLAIAEDFAEANSVFIVITSAKILLR